MALEGFKFLTRYALFGHTDLHTYSDIAMCLKVPLLILKNTAISQMRFNSVTQIKGDCFSAFLLLTVITAVVL